MKYNKKTAFIFAAGLGTRLRPLTDTRPKALVEIAGKPLLQIAIEKIKGAGFQRIVVNAHHFAEQIFDFVEKTDFGVEVIISHEKEQLLDTAGVPPVDLVIRTGGEKRLSNFLLWQTAYAEFYSTDILWPDFTPAHLMEALDAYGKRIRRFGRIV